MLHLALPAADHLFLLNDDNDHNITYGGVLNLGPHLLENSCRPKLSYKRIHSCAGNNYFVNFKFCIRTN